jgi:hypothetical protein
VSGEIASGGQSVALDVRLPGSGTVVAQLLDESGVPIVGSVRIEGITRAYRGYWIDTDAQGQATIPGVPEGTFRIVGEGNFTGIGIAEGNVFVGETVALDVRFGNAATFDVVLEGTDTFRYDLNCYGRVIDGGTSSFSDAFDTANRILLNGVGNSCAMVARTSENGRALEFGATVLGDNGDGYETLPVLFNRKVYSPAAGGFARYLEILTNRGTVARQVEVRITGNFGGNFGSTHLAVDPASNGGRYAVLADTVPQGRAAIAHVFAGVGTSWPPVLSFSEGNDSYSFTWNVTVPAGETVALMHYTMQRSEQEVAALQAAAEAISSLTDASALDALSAEERAEVLNFPLPGGVARLHGTVSGTLFDGATPIPGVPVHAIDLETGLLLGSTRTDAAGQYFFGALSLGPAGARIIAPAPVDPTIIAETTIAFTTDGQSITGADLRFPDDLPAVMPWQPLLSAWLEPVGLAPMR